MRCYYEAAMFTQVLSLFRTYRHSAFETKGIAREVHGGIFDEGVHRRVCSIVNALVSAKLIGPVLPGSVYYRHR